MGNAGLQQEAKCLGAVLLLQSRGWSFNGFTILKAVRTFRHQEPRIARLDGKKFDLVVVFRNADVSRPLIFVLQVKSTKKSYERFLRSPTKKNIKCIWVRENEPLSAVMRDLDGIFQVVLSIDHRHNKFLRKHIPIDLL